MASYRLKSLYPFLLFSTVLHADVEVTRLPTTIIEATRMEQSDLNVPFAVSQINGNVVQTANPQLALDESLQTVPGVFILNPYNYAQDSRIAIRGFGSRANFGIRGIKLYIDGIPATTPDGQGSVDAIDFGSVGSIEIIRGAASALYGSASGGVIQIETEAPPVTPFAETRWTIGDYGLLQTQFKAGGTADLFSYLVSTSYLEYDGYRDRSKTENRRFNSKFSYDFSPQSKLTAIISIIDLPLQNDPGALSEAEWRENPSQARRRNIDFDSGESVQQEQVGLIYDYQFSDFHSIETRAYYTHRDFANKLPFTTGGQVSFERDFVGGGLLYRYSGDRWLLASGIDYNLQEDARLNYDNLSAEQGPLRLDQDEAIESMGLFVSGSYNLIDTVTFSAALRQDFVDFDIDDHFFADGDDSGSRDFQELSPMIGMTWEWHPQSAVFANVSTSFETPTSTELANPNGGGFNPDLDPQTAVNYEIGIKGYTELHDRQLRYEVTVFHIEIEDALIPFELISDPGRDFFRNAGESSRTGIEAAWQLELINGLTANLSYTWSNFRYDDFESGGDDFGGNELPGIPEHFANLQLSYKHSSGVFLKWNTRFVGSFYADDTNSAEIDSYSVSDLRAGYTYRRDSWTLEPFFGINNVFDEYYNANIRINGFGGRYYEPAPDRNLYGGVRVRYHFE